MGKMTMKIIPNENNEYNVEFEEERKKDKFPKSFDIVKRFKTGSIYSFFLTEEKPVLISDTIIKSRRFKNETDLKAVKLISKEDSKKKTIKFLTTIESNAFENCTELKEVYFDKIASSETEKETNYATLSVRILLNGKLVESVPKNKGIKLYIQPNSFYNCAKLHTVILPPCGKLIIEKSAFEGCSALRTVLILCSQAEINEDAFAGCDNVVLVSNCENVLSFARNHGLEYIDVR